MNVAIKIKNKTLIFLFMKKNFIFEFPVNSQQDFANPALRKDS